MTRCILTAALLTATTAGIAAAEPPKEFVLEQVTVKDPMVNNMVAGTLYKPKGWKFDGGMKWYPETYHQVCFEARVSDPNGPQQYEALPWCSCIWLTQTIVPIPRMSNYIGCLFLEPMTPAEVNEKLMVATTRKQYKPRVVKHYDMPEVAKFFSKALGGAEVKATRTRVEYKLDGKTVEEDFYLVLGYSSSNILGSTCTVWGPVVPPFALRAARGELDDATPRLLSIAHSGWLNPKWADEVGYVQSLFIKRMYKASADAVELSKRISANNDYILGIMRESRDYRNAVEDRAAKNFSDYIRGVQEYGGNGSHYTLPSGYSYAWASGNGTVVLTNNANYNPNVGGTGTWTLLKPVTR